MKNLTKEEIKEILKEDLTVYTILSDEPKEEDWSDVRVLRLHFDDNNISFSGDIPKFKPLPREGSETVKNLKSIIDNFIDGRYCPFIITLSKLVLNPDILEDSTAIHAFVSLEDKSPIHHIIGTLEDLEIIKELALKHAGGWCRLLFIYDDGKTSAEDVCF